MMRGGDPPTDPPPSSESGSFAPVNSHHHHDHDDQEHHPDDLVPPRPPPTQQPGNHRHDDHRRHAQKDPPGFHVKRHRQQQKQQQQQQQTHNDPTVGSDSNSVSSSLVMLISDRDCAAMQAAHAHDEDQRQHNRMKQLATTTMAANSESAAAAAAPPQTTTTSEPTHVPLQLSPHEELVEDSLLVLVPSDDCAILRRNEANERHVRLGGNQQQQVLVEMELELERQQQQQQQHQVENNNMVEMVPSDECVILNQDEVQERHGRLGGNQQLQEVQAEVEMEEKEPNMGDVPVVSNQQLVTPQDLFANGSIDHLAKPASKIASVSQNNRNGKRADPPSNEDMLKDRGKLEAIPSHDKESKTEQPANLSYVSRKDEPRRQIEPEASSYSSPFSPFSDRKLEDDNVDTNVINETEMDRARVATSNMTVKKSALPIVNTTGTVPSSGGEDGGSKDLNRSKHHPQPCLPSPSTFEKIPDNDVGMLASITELQVDVMHKSTSAAAPRDPPLCESVDGGTGKDNHPRPRQEMIESLAVIPLANENESAIQREGQLKNVTPLSTNTETPADLSLDQDIASIDVTDDDSIFRQSVVALNSSPTLLADRNICEDLHENCNHCLEETKESLEVEEPACCVEQIYPSPPENTVDLIAGAAVGRSSRVSRAYFDPNHGGSRNSGHSVESSSHLDEESKEPLADHFPSLLPMENVETNIAALVPSTNEAQQRPAATAPFVEESMVLQSRVPPTNLDVGKAKGSENLLTLSGGSLQIIDLVPSSQCDTDAASTSPPERIQPVEGNENPMNFGTRPRLPIVSDSLNLHHMRLSSLVRSSDGDRSSIAAPRQAAPDPTDVPTKHGAYDVVKATPPGCVTYEVLVPDGCGPGDIFLAEAGNRLAEVTVPLDYEPGEPLEFPFPLDSITTYKPLKVGLLTASPAAEAAWKKQPFWCRSRSDSIGGAFPMHGPIREINEAAMQAGKSVARTHIVTIPDNAGPGALFEASADGFTFQATCPVHIPEDRRIRIVPPPPPCEPPKAMQYFRVEVPPGIRAGDQFAAVIDNGHERLEVLVECPEGRAGKTITVSLPTQTVVGKIALSYESHRRSGWRRTVRAYDLQFQWVRMRRESAITESVDSFDFFKSAFVRQIILLEGHDPRLCTASLLLVPAAEAVSASKLRLGGKSIISYADLAKQQVRPLAEKHEWFTGICRDLTQLRSTVKPPNSGDFVNDAYVEIFVRREHLLRDSMRGVLSLSVAQMWANWRIRWLGEPALDDGGLTKEFFQLVTKELFDPATGLFVGESVVDIHPLCGSKCQDTALMYYRFAGRILGRALFSNHQIKGHLVRTLYKHLLGWPLTYEDVRDQDEAFYRSCEQLAKGIDLSSLEIYFSAPERFNGKHVEIELVDGGAYIKVTSENLAEYLEARLRYKVFDRILPQLTELLLGFYDVIPEPALTVFDTGELELLLCGLPTIDVADWKTHTEYTGEFEKFGLDEPVVKWFWELVEEFDAEMRARLLQFATGTSSVPSSGFEGLRGHNGMPQKFTLHGVADPHTCFYPKSHTCFNRIDCQRYKSKTTLKERLIVSITTTFVGFDDE